MKVVYNTCFGGFSISKKAVLRGREISGNLLWAGPCLDGDRYESGEVLDYDHDSREIERFDPVLIQVIEELGVEADGNFAALMIKDIPHGTRYRICEYDGQEWIETPEDIGWSIAT